MSDAFLPEELAGLREYLNKDGYACVTFKGLNGVRAALSDPSTAVLVVKADEVDVSPLIEVLRAEPGNLFGIPVLACFKQPAAHHKIEMLPPEIDDFLLEPFNRHDTSLRIRRLARRFTGSQDEQVKLHLLSHFGMQQFIGRSPAFVSALEKIPRIASSDAAVLLVGETGTGKEMCASGIHYLSARADKPLIPVNCGSIPPNLFENEMFGHEPGAYTDARHARRGLIAEAEGGTLFLDEVDSLSLSDQAKLLRFLQDKQYKPLGSSQYRQSDTRVLTASNQRLQDRVRARAFREDLYYRLNVVSLELPALRERREDITLLANHFLEVAGREYNRAASRFSSEALACMTAYDWPGNVRELENTIRQAVVLNEKSVIQASDLKILTPSRPAASAPAESFKSAKARVVETFERNYLQELLSACGGNISQAARAARKNRRAFFALLKKHNLTTAPTTPFAEGSNEV
jgi:two-component system response regulator GlrR